MSAFDLDPPLVRRMENLCDMMRRLGLDPIVAGRQCDGAVLGSVVRICEGCRAGEVCHAGWRGRPSRCTGRPPSVPTRIASRNCWRRRVRRLVAARVSCGPQEAA